MMLRFLIAVLLAISAMTAEAATTTYYLSWNVAVENVTEWQVERKATGGSYVALGTSSRDVPYYADSTAVVGISYRYRVRGVVGSTAQVYSNETCLPTACPAAPTAVTPSGVSNAPQYHLVGGTLGNCLGRACFALSCSSSDVQNIINAAQNGQWVIIPPGACTWETSVKIGGASSRTKMVKIRGAGVDATNGTRITASRIVESKVQPVLYAYQSRNLSAFELTNIRFLQGSDAGDDESCWALALQGNADTEVSLFRVHHVTFVQLGESVKWLIMIGHEPGIANAVGESDWRGSDDYGHPYVWGVFDHNTWSGGVSFQIADVIPRSDLDENGDDITGCTSDCSLGNLAWRDWKISDHQGTWRNVIYETNTFDATALTPAQAYLDAGCGGTYVARYNTVINGWFAGHGVDTLNGCRSTKWQEFYENNFVTRATVDEWVMALGFKGGTGVVWNNRFWDGTHRGTGNPYGITEGGVEFELADGGTSFASIDMTYRRAEGTTYRISNLCNAVACGDETTSTCDNKTTTSDPGKGWMCIDQPGVRRADTDDATRSLGYALVQEPVVFWNNTWADTANLVGDGLAMPRIYGDGPPTAAQVAQYVQERREYIRDASCTDHMEESVCSTFWDATNSKKKNYTPYTYPHPRTLR